MKSANEPNQIASQPLNLFRMFRTNRLFNPHPSITDIVERRKAQLTVALSIVLTITNTMALFFVDKDGTKATFYLQIALAIITFLAYLLSRRPYFIWGSVLLVTSLSLSGFANVLLGSDDPASALYLTVPIAVVIGSALLPVWGNVVLVVGSIIGVMLLPLAYLPYTYNEAGSNVAFLFVSGILLVVVQVFRDNVERARLAEVEATNQELRELGTKLEQRVADRTKALATSSDVSRRLSTILDKPTLAREVVEQVQSAFNYYHAHIYFFDDDNENLVMAGGTGEAGAAMLASGHRIPRGRGLVGRAAETNAPVLVADVSQSIGWLPNPLLPETLSEAAVPISMGNKVLGVLDVQHNVVNGLDENDIALLQSLSGQVAISLQNAISFEQSRSKAEMEALVNVIGQKIQRTASMEEALQTAIREVGLALGATSVRASIGLDTNPADQANQN